jgi:sulfur carrier protein
VNDELRLSVNGDPLVLSTGRTVADLLSHLGLKGQVVAVEVNRQLVPKKQHDATTLNPGDAVEVVKLVGGG